MTRIPIDDDEQQPQDATAGPGGPQDQQGQVLEGEPQDRTDTGSGVGGGDADVDRVRAERDMLYEKLARAQADFTNSRRRLQQESDQRAVYANASLIKSLLPVIDNFERALAQDPSKTDTTTLLKGMQIVHDQWLNVLRQQQVQEINPQPGEAFDPTRHEALLQQPSEHPDGSVVQVLQKGYALHDRTLRPAQVSVSRKA
jgi:molecular chaperone GrpE